MIFPLHKTFSISVPFKFDNKIIVIIIVAIDSVLVFSFLGINMRKTNPKIGTHNLTTTVTWVSMSKVIKDLRFFSLAPSFRLKN